MDVKAIWRKRLGEHITEVRTYLRYMLNDHLLIVLIFIAAGGALTYQEWLHTITPEFPGVFLISIVFAFVLTNSYVRTLLKEPDIVFLLPVEMKMKEYFKQSFTYSFFSQLYLLLITAAFLAPLYFAVTEAAFTGYLLIFAQLLVIKAWNLFLSWHNVYSVEALTKYGDFIVRLTINFLVSFFILNESYLFAGILYVVMIGLALYLYKDAKRKSFKWEEAIDQELRRKQGFYRLANLFTDVPKLKKQAKRRVYLDFLLSLIPNKQDHVFTYMFARAFLRSGDFLGIYLRLTVIGGVLLWFMTLNLYSILILVIFVLYLTGVQIASLYKHYDLLTLPDLYPIKKSTKSESFFRLVLSILIIQGLLLSIVLIIKVQLVAAVLSLIVSVGFSYVFVMLYLKQRMVKRNLV
ncbi:ABC transporter permease [Metabacillus arenae]|uniref:ABC transporter permease n=1 Tax=Metabacillus arenae TaxID=2771434 RepID=A0A926RWE6_9BACI|nr:ABC transporter permease [Metabacillus arenae]MBD1380703.1 ABC transporter permease [Metabacillus arenae]